MGTDLRSVSVAGPDLAVIPPQRVERWWFRSDQAVTELIGSRQKQLQLSNSAVTAIPLAITWLHVGMPFGTSLRAEMLPANPD